MSSPSTSTNKSDNDSDGRLETVPLAYRSNYDEGLDSTTTSRLPTTLFIHGLDSSSQTWIRVLSQLDHYPQTQTDETGDNNSWTHYPGVSIDCRGCGYSALNEPTSFTPNSIVEDIREFIVRHPHLFPTADDDDDTNDTKEPRPFVIVGHSMGARIAMSFAATYPQYVKALVVEDMDVRRRPVDTNPIPMDVTTVNARKRILEFERRFVDDDVDGVYATFRRLGYPKDYVDKWIKDGRIYIYDKGDTNADTSDRNYDHYYSEVNPAFRLLCYEQFFDTDHGEDTWGALSTICYNEDRTLAFPVHVMVAGKEGTVCDESSIRLMKSMFDDRERTEGSLPFALFLHRYPNATHSIHNSEQGRYLKDLTEIIRTASLGS